MIHRERPNTIGAHLLTWFHGNEDHYFGNFSGNKFEVWRFTRGAQGFHPVINGVISTDEHGELQVKLTPKMNPFAYVQLSVVAIGWILLTVFSGINHFFAIGIAVLFTFLMGFAYRYETKYHLNELKERIDRELG